MIIRCNHNYIVREWSRKHNNRLVPRPLSKCCLLTCPCTLQLTNNHIWCMWSTTNATVCLELRATAHYGYPLHIQHTLQTDNHTLDKYQKEQMINPATKTFTYAGHIDAKLINFSQICQKNPSKIGCFLLIVSWRSFPPKFPMKSADFPKNLPLKILRKLTFFR